MELPLLKIAICVATRWEFDALGRAFPSGQTHDVKGFRSLTYQVGELTVFVVQTGMGQEKVVAAFHALLDDQTWDLIVSSGFAGALVPASIGTIVLSTQVFDLDQDQVWEFNRGESVLPYLRLARFVGEEIGSPPLQGLVVMVKRIVWLASHKASIAEHTQGLALDMESGTIGKLTTDRHIPFLVVRTISDVLEESLPLDLNLFCQKSTWIQGVFHLILHPRQLWQFNRLRKQMLVAGGQLTRFFQSFCSQLARCPSQL